MHYSESEYTVAELKQKNQAAGTASPCYVTKLLEETEGMDEEAVRSTAAIIYSGGVDTVCIQ